MPSASRLKTSYESLNVECAKVLAASNEIGRKGLTNASKGLASLLFTALSEQRSFSKRYILIGGLRLMQGALLEDRKFAKIGRALESTIKTLKTPRIETTPLKQLIKAEIVDDVLNKVVQILDSVASIVASGQGKRLARCFEGEPDLEEALQKAKQQMKAVLQEVFTAVKTFMSKGGRLLRKRHNQQARLYNSRNNDVEESLQKKDCMFEYVEEPSIDSFMGLFN